MTAPAQREFKSLDALSYALEYGQAALARISSTLLMLGLVLSMANFLLNDSIFRGARWTEGLWAVFQALAVDANLSVVFALVIEAHQNKHRALVVLYGILGVLLVFVAVVITNTEALRQSLGIPLVSAYDQMHIPLWIPTLLRSFVAVGLVAASGVSSRLRFKQQSRSTRLKEATQVDEVAQVAETPTIDTAAALHHSTQLAQLPTNGHDERNAALEKFLAYTSTHPEATNTDIMRATGISKSGVSRLRKKVSDGVLEPASTRNN